MNYTKELILASRPKTLFASMGPVILGLSINYYLNNKLHLLSALVTLLCAVLLQASSNFINDYYDGIKGIDGEDRLGPKRATTLGLLPPKIMRNSFISTLVISFSLGLYLMNIGGLPIIIIGLSSILFAYLYTGGPFPLSYFALGELVAFLFFGPIAVFGTYYIQSQDFHFSVLILGMSVGFCSAAIMGVNNLRDILSDSKTKKITIAILLGEKNMRRLIMALIFLSQAPQLYLVAIEKWPLSLLLSLITPFLFLKTWKAILTEKISSQFNDYLANIGKYLFLVSLIVSVTLIYGS